LKVELPKTDGVTDGKIVVEITPQQTQIPDPTSLGNGVKKVKFFGTVDAGFFSFDNSANPPKSILTIKTPTTQSFKESEVPITFTTEGIFLFQFFDFFGL